ncbi:hypothetical protein FS837_004116 [Tulasnella sp. UAMH 9824]|nr:hypothetical protein FS837_004116 [Tulasnella sp. UAMH 9824]
MSADVQSQPSPPEIKTIDKLVAIPIVHDSLSTIHQTLSTYVPTAYGYGQALTTSAYSLSAPLQVRLAPLIVSADGYALKGLDAAQAKFPAPFTVTTDDVVQGIKSRKDNAVNAVTRPVYGLANGVDSSLTPIVDRIEAAVHNTLGAPAHAAEASDASSSSDASSASFDGTPAPATTQVGRLYHLSLDVKNQIVVLSSEQLRNLQTQNVYIQAATERLHNLNDSLNRTKDKSIELVHETRNQANVYTNNILAELEKVQTATLALPKNLQTHLAPVRAEIESSFHEITGIVKSDLPVGDKVSKVGHHVQEKLARKGRRGIPRKDHDVIDGVGSHWPLGLDIPCLRRAVYVEAAAKATGRILPEIAIPAEAKVTESSVHFH